MLNCSTFARVISLLMTNFIADFIKMLLVEKEFDKKQVEIIVTHGKAVTQGPGELKEE